jgi:hypothetical protein
MRQNKAKRRRKEICKGNLLSRTTSSVLKNGFSY